MSREVLCPNRGDGRPGRIDLVAERGDELIAFELDDRSPRSKSAAKLAGLSYHTRVIVLRYPLDGRMVCPTGIDLVIGAGRAVPALPSADAEPTSSLTPEEIAAWMRPKT